MQSYLIIKILLNNIDDIPKSDHDQFKILLQRLFVMVIEYLSFEVQVMFACTILIHHESVKTKYPQNKIVIKVDSLISDLPKIPEWCTLLAVKFKDKQLLTLAPMYTSEGPDNILLSILENSQATNAMMQNLQSSANATNTMMQNLQSRLIDIEDQLQQRLPTTSSSADPVPSTSQPRRGTNQSLLAIPPSVPVVENILEVKDLASMFYMWYVNQVYNNTTFIDSLNYDATSNLKKMSKLIIYLRHFGNDLVQSSFLAARPVNSNTDEFAKWCADVKFVATNSVDKLMTWLKGVDPKLKPATIQKKAVWTTEKRIKKIPLEEFPPLTRPFVEDKLTPTSLKCICTGRLADTRS